MRSTLEKFQVLKLKVFLFIDSDGRHTGEYVLHTSICALIASAVYVTFMVRHVNSRARSEGHVQGADSFFIQHTVCVSSRAIPYPESI